MKLQTRKSSWFVSGLLLLVAVSAGVEAVLAQPKGEPSRPAFDTGRPAFEMLGENKLVNINNIAYTTDGDGIFDIYFACSSTRGEDPLRLTDPKDLTRARSYFNDQKRHVDHLFKLNKHSINLRHIAYIESGEDSVIVSFNARIADSFVKVTLSGADAETFKAKMREY